jgi:hypothetical protein
MPSTTSSSTGSKTRNHRAPAPRWRRSTDCSCHCGKCGDPAPAHHRPARRPGEVVPAGRGAFGEGFDETFQRRRQEADEFYATVIPRSLGEDAANVMRQALAGMLWTKQFYYFDLNRWLEERGHDPFFSLRKPLRNEHWRHMYNSDIISMPDKWEYPWYAAWDLAFGARPPVDAISARGSWFDAARDLPAPQRQIPAYEWNFGDVNPPVHARHHLHYRLEKAKVGKGDFARLERCFRKLLPTSPGGSTRKTAMAEPSRRIPGPRQHQRSTAVRPPVPPRAGRWSAWMALFSLNMLETPSSWRWKRPPMPTWSSFIQHFVSSLGDIHCRQHR